MAIPTRDEMYDTVIQMYGFEHERTIWFFQLAEELDDSALFNAFIVLTNLGE